MIKKKIIKEDTSSVDESSAAAATLHAGSAPDSNPKSRLETMAAVIGNIAKVKDGKDLTHWYTSMIDQIGHEADKLPANATKDHNQGTIKTHGEETVTAIKNALQEDLVSIFEGSDLSEEFKSRASTLFEAAIEARVNVALAQLEEENEVRIEEEVGEIVSELVERIDQYLDYSANKWLEENEVAVESALRNEIASEFMEGIKRTFEENYLNIPEEQTDVVDQLANAVEETEDRLNDVMTENAELRSMLEDYAKSEIVDELSEGLTVVEKEKLREMASTINTSDIEEFSKKVEVIKESTFVKGGNKSPTLITEQLEEVDEDNTPETPKTYSSPQMKSYVDAIRRTVKN